MSLKIDRKEADIESVFTKACRRYGGVARKYTSPGQRGVPDRLVYWGNGVTTYAELKRPGEELRPDQQEEIGLLLKMGHLAMVIRNEADTALFIKLSMERVMNAH